jgi:hypothetical protein
MIYETVPKDPTPAAEESRALTFAGLKDLIERGKTDQIPNNKHIPEAINVSKGFLPHFDTIHRLLFCSGCFTKQIDRTVEEETMGDSNRMKR